MTQPALSLKKYKVDDPFQATDMYFEKGWTGGLPVVPPTEARVRQFIQCVGRSPSEVLCQVPVRRRTITLEYEEQCV